MTTARHWLLQTLGIATAVNATVRGANAQTPRISPPPPCRAVGRAPVIELIEQPTPTGIVVAVLPLEARLSSDNQVHLPWAVAGGISNGLSALPGVAAPTRGSIERASAGAAGRFDEFARLTGARLVVTGVVTSTRGGASVSLRVLEPGIKAPRWEREFDYPRTSLASIEDQVVSAVSEILAIKRPVEQSRPSVDVAAYDEIASGDFFLAQHDVWAADSARAAYERALIRLPNSAVVQAKLARAYATALERRGRVSPLGPVPSARQANTLVDRALKTDSSTAEAWIARGILERVRDPGLLGSAVRAHERAVRLAPRSADAHHELAVTLLRLGRDEAAESHLRKALTLDRDRATSLRVLAELEYVARRYPAACALVNASIGADSYDPLAYALRARVRMRLDEFRDAFSDAETARRLSGAAWGESLQFYVTAYAREFDAAKSDAQRLSRSKLRAGSTLGIREAAYLSMGLSAVGSRDKAFDALARARPRGAELRSALRDPGFDAMRSDPRFARVGREEPAPVANAPRARPGS
jgi:Flp pilus assembly protein TadD/TolB-like protein